MRILHTSDWHRAVVENINRKRSSGVYRPTCEIADEERIDLVLVAGDVYDL